MARVIDYEDDEDNEKPDDFSDIRLSGIPLHLFPERLPGLFKTAKDLQGKDRKRYLEGHGVSQKAFDEYWANRSGEVSAIDEVKAMDYDKRIDQAITVITDLVSTRTLNYLIESGYSEIRDLQVSNLVIRKIDGVGATMVQEITDALAAIGIKRYNNGKFQNL